MFNVTTGNGVTVQLDADAVQRFIDDMQISDKDVTALAQTVRESATDDKMLDFIRTILQIADTAAKEAGHADGIKKLPRAARLTIMAREAIVWGYTTALQDVKKAQELTAQELADE